MKKNVTACYDAASAELIQDMSTVHPSVAHGCNVAAFDANETMVVARQLETIKNKLYEIKYEQLKARKFVPDSSAAGNEAEFLTYRIWTAYTMAKVVVPGSTDIPMVNSSVVEKTIKPFMVADGYDYSVDDLRKAQAAGVPLTSKLAEAARLGIELAREDVTAFGVTELGSYGLLNHPNVSLRTLPNGNWSAASAEDILEDLNHLVTQMQVDTLDIFSPNTILLSVSAFRLLSTKLLNSGNASNISVLNMFKAQNPGIGVESWTKLANANAAGNNGRIVCYHKSSEVLEFETATEFEVMPVEYSQMRFTTVCRAKYFGVQVYYPHAITYSDNQLV